MDSKFENIKVDFDTKILQRKQLLIDEFEALYELWVWDGWYGESVVLNEDLNNYTNKDIEILVRKSGLIKDESECEIKKIDDKFIFVNFNLM